jgi:hypothetical protein
MAAAQGVITDSHTKTGGEQVECQKRVVAAKVDDACGEVMDLFLLCSYILFFNLSASLGFILAIITQTFTQFKIRRKHKFVVFKIDLEVSNIHCIELIQGLFLF